jgi:tRNA dimethylallyltransferase
MTVTPMTIDAPLLIVITGPTAVGKTSLSIQIAKHFSTEIISADSRQFYKELKIGTAVPSDEELNAVKHHFIGHLSIHDYYNVSRFESDALDLLGKLFSNHKTVVMTGGSGLYINGVCHGIDALPDPDDSLRRSLAALYTSGGIGVLREKLKELDPEYYRQVDLANPKRLLRALEVCMTAGVPYSSLRRNQPGKRSFHVLKAGLSLDREELFARINDRVDRMIASGLVEEARSMLPFRHLNALNTVGYKELFDHFDGKMSLDQAIKDIKTNSRRYAKRQLTWLRKDPAMTWFHPGDPERILNFIENFIQTQ